MAPPILHGLLTHVRRSAGAPDGGSQSDAELLERFLAVRDQAAFTALVRRHGGLVLAACRRVLAERADVEDAFQATFLVLIRKARTIRRHQSLAGWLYRVAYRVALQVRSEAARQRQWERIGDTAEPAAADGPDPTWREVCALLHAELDRLPMKMRLPLILCYLDGKTRDEAAQQLGWTVGAVKGYLERGRKRLRDRLARRGVTLSAGLLATLAAPRALAVPPHLVDSTSQMALTVSTALAGTGAALSRADLLAQGVLQTMRTTRRIVTAVALLIAGAVGTGTGLLARHTPADPPPAGPPPAAQAKPTDKTVQAAPAAPSIPFLTKSVTGQVLLPDGKPAAGAKLHSIGIKRFPPRTEQDAAMVEYGTADAEGRFRVQVPRLDMFTSRPMPLVATAPGYGLGWADMKADSGLTIRLTPEQPVTGRLLDSEGRPIAGARLSLTGVQIPPGGRLDKFLDGWKQSWNDAVSSPVERMYVPVTAQQVTDAQGRFRITGVGPERIVLVQVNGPGIAQDTLYVLTRPGLDARPYNQAALERIPPDLRIPGQPPQLYGPSFDYVATPAKRIEGTVRERGTGKPIAGVTVSAIAGFVNHVSAVTDAQGRFRLEGMPKHKEYNLHAEAPQGSGLIARSVRFPDTEGLLPVPADIELAQGVIVTGRVLDKATGKGVQGGIRFAPLPDNKFFGQPGYDSYKAERLMHEVDREGRFRLAIIPGPGVLMVQVYGMDKSIGGVPVKPYKLAEFTAEEKQRVKLRDDGDDRSFAAAGNALEVLGTENAVKIVDYPEGAGTVTCDLTVDPGRTLTVNVQGPDGQPLAGALVSGLTASWPITFPIAQTSATVYALDPARPRQLVALHAQKNLAGSLTVRGDETEPPVLKLAPVGSVTGRLLDSDGQPIAGADVGLSYRSQAASDLDRQMQQLRSPVRTDADGRFRLENVVPGQKFWLSIRKGQTFLAGKPRIGERQVEAGATLDLADFRTEPQRR